MEKLLIHYELLHPETLPPTQVDANDAGWDVSNIEDVYIEPREDKKLRTGLCLDILPGHYIQVASRLGLSLECKIMVMEGGVMDHSY